MTLLGTHALGKDKVMGRPKQLNRRDRQLNIRFTGEEFSAIARRAEGQGEEPVEYGRRVLLEGTDTAPALLLPSRFDRLVELQLRRLGNLLNQLVRHMHQTGEIQPEAASLLHDVRLLIDRCLS